MKYMFRGILAMIVPLLLFGCSGSETTETLTASQLFQVGMEAYDDNDDLEAIKQFEIIRLQYPGSAVADSARFYSGMSRFKRGEFLLATYEFNQLIQRSSGSDLTPDAYYQWAMCYYEMSPKPPLDQSYTVTAVDAIQSFIELYPTHEKAPQAEKQVRELVNKLAEKEYITAVLYTKLKNWRAALIYFDTVIDRYYSTDFADDAMAAKINLLMDREDYGQAYPVIKDFLKRHPESSYYERIADYKKDLDEILPPGYDPGG